MLVRSIVCSSLSLIAMRLGVMALPCEPRMPGIRRRPRRPAVRAFAISGPCPQTSSHAATSRSTKPQRRPTTQRSRRSSGSTTGYLLDPFLDRVASAVGRGRALDLGCGTGVITVSLAERGFDVVGVDHSPDMLAIAEQKLAGSRTRRQARADDGRCARPAFRIGRVRLRHLSGAAAPPRGHPPVHRRARQGVEAGRVLLRVRAVCERDAAQADRRERLAQVAAAAEADRRSTSRSQWKRRSTRTSSSRSSRTSACPSRSSFSHISSRCASRCRTGSISRSSEPPHIRGDAARGDLVFVFGRKPAEQVGTVPS